MKTKIVTGLILFLISCVLTGCASRVPNDPLLQLQTLNSDKVLHTTGSSGIRMQAMQDTALKLGAQEALAVQSEKIDALLDKNGRSLDQIFNFSILVMHRNVLPPVLTVADNAMRLDGTDALRLAGRVYRIAQQAKIVTVPPTWRDYLWMAFPKPGRPDPALLPRCCAEQKVWKEYVTLGWHQGLEQATSIFSANVARLRRNYNGIILYRELLAEHMVSPPYVIKSNLGVTGGGNAMRVNDQVLRITALPRLNPNSHQWLPAVKLPAEDHIIRKLLLYGKIPHGTPHFK